MKLDYTGQFDAMIQSVLQPPPAHQPTVLRCADFFCGIGGFHVAASNLGLNVVWAATWTNARSMPTRRTSTLSRSETSGSASVRRARSRHSVRGIPLPPFSIIGRQQGFSDPRGNLFFELLRVVRVKRPRGIVLENVKQLATADNGRVIQRIVSDLEQLGYQVSFKILNALDFGLPQKRERTIIVAAQSSLPFTWPTGAVPMRPLSTILEPDPDASYYVSDDIRLKRQAHQPAVTPSIWHENKAGHISSHPWSCALRAGASYNYLLVNGERRLTTRELLRLQGFPESWKVVCSHAQTRKQTGNAVPVPVVQAVLENVVDLLERTETARAEVTGVAVPIRSVRFRRCSSWNWVGKLCIVSPSGSVI